MDFPTLAQHLGDGNRAEGFEEWVAANYAAEVLSGDEGAKATGRIIRTLTIAMVEAGRRENEEGADYFDTVLRMGRGAGVALMAAVMSTLRDDAPLDEARDMIVKLVSEGADWFLKQHATTPPGEVK